jgi:hypothetical protein
MKIQVHILLLLICLSSDSIFSQQKQPNILFIAIDDMNDWTGFLGGHPQAITPNLDKIAKKGLIVRHLVLPDNIENSLKVLGYIKEIDKDIYINLMSQYEPVYKAKKFPEINRNIKKKEFEKIFNYALKLGFKNGWIQDTKNQSMFLPDFTKENPFSNDDFLLR